MSKRKNIKIRLNDVPLGENRVIPQLAVEKLEKRPKEVRFSGINKVSNHLSPLDLVEPNNLGYSSRTDNLDSFLNKKIMPKYGLVQGKMVDEMSKNELLGVLHGKKVRVETAKDVLGRKRDNPNVGKNERLLAALDKSGTFCGYCTSRCSGKDKDISYYI